MMWAILKWIAVLAALAAILIAMRNWDFDRACRITADAVIDVIGPRTGENFNNAVCGGY